MRLYKYSNFSKLVLIPQITFSLVKSQFTEMYLLFPLMFTDFKSPSDPKFLEAFGKSYLGRPFILLLKMLPHARIE
jgi:hypothetical protein